MLPQLQLELKIRGRDALYVGDYVELRPNNGWNTTRRDYPLLIIKKRVGDEYCRVAAVSPMSGRGFQATVPLEHLQRVTYKDYVTWEL
jgi:hypothetical protein